MLTLTCYLRFKDGQIITAKINAHSKTDDVTVSYAGPVERLPLSPEKANALELYAYFQSFARELGAQFSEEQNDDQALPTGQVDELLEGLRRLKPRPRRTRA